MVAITEAQRRADARYAHVAAGLGMEGSARLLLEARHAGLSPTLALALRTQETGIKGDGNVFGHDQSGNHVGAGEVTKAGYEDYKRKRGPRGAGGMQGVGPLQLTYYSIQDEADRLGGCWIVKYNYRVGFQDLAHLIRLYGSERKALAVYNGGAAQPNYAYADSVLGHQRFWHEKLT